MSAILMTVESVRTRATTNEALLTLAVPIEQAALISKFIGMIGQKVGVAFAEISGKPVLTEEETAWANLPALTRSAITLCKEPRFQQFIASLDAGEDASETRSAKYIKDYCKVSSRKELESVDGAKERFGSLMALYREWQQRDGRRKSH